jgi:broad specificity phosphatase PhoE
MRTIFHLIRHAAHDRIGSVLVGRLNGVHLSLAGRAEAKELARAFSREEISAVISSPRERAQETAEPIAQELGLIMRISNALDEVNFGGWQGQSFSGLAADQGWQRWNAFRSMARPPRGETITEVQSRMMGEMLHLHATDPGWRVHSREPCRTHPRQPAACPGPERRSCGAASRSSPPRSALSCWMKREAAS